MSAPHLKVMDRIAQAYYQKRSVVCDENVHIWEAEGRRKFSDILSFFLVIYDTKASLGE